MYKIVTETEGIIARFPTLLEALAYCDTFNKVRLNPDGTFSPMRIEGKDV